MYFSMYLIVFVTLYLTYCAMAGSLEEKKLQFANYIMDCSKEFPITSEDLVSLKNKEIPDSMNVKCLLACAYKKCGMMDEDGKLAVDGIKKIADEVFADEPELKKKSEEFTEACKFVNDAEIEGEIKECERAVLIFNCSVQKPPKFEMKI